MKYTVLMPVYHGDTEERFYRSLRSITLDQSIYPDEVIVVQDGPVDFKLSLEMLEESGIFYKLLILEENCGIVKALNSGLAQIDDSIVVRMDSDDIALPRRIELTKQCFGQSASLKLICGGMFECNVEDNVKRRRTPRGFPLSKYVTRNPFFHPAVAYRCDTVKAVGGYRNFPGFEDFDLWLRLELSSVEYKIIQEPLILFTITKDFYRRRSGIKYLRREIAYLRTIKSEQLYDISLSANVIFRLLLRLLPNQLINVLYNKRT